MGISIIVHWRVTKSLILENGQCQCMIKGYIVLSTVSWNLADMKADMIVWIFYYNAVIVADKWPVFSVYFNLLFLFYPLILCCIYHQILFLAFQPILDLLVKAACKLSWTKIYLRLDGCSNLFHICSGKCLKV